ncbi:MAG: thiazole synthase [Anaerolineae bacterium]
MGDPLVIGGRTLHNRLFVGTGKFRSYDLIPQVIEASGTQVVTVAVRRLDMDTPAENMATYLPAGCLLMANTSGARNAQEAMRLARLARSAGCSNWIKIEIVTDQKYLLPDNHETIKATEILAGEGFVVLPYISPDLIVCRQLVRGGAAAVMPLGSPIGSNRGLRTKEMLRILLAEIEVPVIVDAGIGKPSAAAEAMEMGCAAVLVNTAIATARDPVAMAVAFSLAVQAGRRGYLAGLPPAGMEAVASSPLTGFLGDSEGV